VQSNAVAGGTTWRWFWNGEQFLNHSDYGREIQGAFYPDPNPSVNPNEAGDQLTFAFLDQSLKHGSPVIRFENQGNTQITRAIPLNWDAGLYGGDQDHPVIWDSLIIGKDLVLNFNNMGSVAKYTTHLSLPNAMLGGMAEPAIYLRASFTRFWTYDAPSKTLREVTNSVPSGCAEGKEFFHHAAFGGTIISDDPGSHALGVYGVNEASGGSVSYFSLGKYLCEGDGPDESAGDTVVMNVVRGGGDGFSQSVMFPAGESTYNVYLVSDSVQNVAIQMDRLYAMRVK
jgi:hypothetical protein